VAIALPLAVLNEKYRRANENADSRQLVIKPSGKRYSGEVIAQSPQFKAILDSAYRIADSDAPVLILGETGTGQGGRGPLYPSVQQAGQYALC
jgi:DNA-binding NtrC family response regulator